MFKYESNLHSAGVLKLVYEREQSIIANIANGLLRVESGKFPDAVPYPLHLMRGWELLNAYLIDHQNPPIPTICELYDWCRKPINQWSGEFLQIFQSGVQLLFDLPSDFCRQQEREGSDIQAPLIEEILMLGFISECKKLSPERGEQVYRESRRFLIEHPVVLQSDIIQFSIQFPEISASFLDFYEDVPRVLYQRNEIPVCPSCGWTLNLAGSMYRCGISDLCKESYMKMGVKEFDSKNQVVKRVRQPIMRFVSFPGIPELSLLRSLDQIPNISVELWPQIDRYDFRVTFLATGDIWVVDVKDYAEPTDLVRYLKKKEINPGEWKRGFYCVSDRRIKALPTYLTIVNNSIDNERKTWDILSVRQLLKEVKQVVKS